MARKHGRESRKKTPRDDKMVVFAAAGEPKLERKLRCHHTRVRFHTSLRGVTTADAA